MQVLGESAYIVGALEAEQGDGDVGLDEGHGAGVFEEADYGGVGGGRVVCVLGAADAGVVASDADGVFERYGDAGQGAWFVCLLAFEAQRLRVYICHGGQIPFRLTPSPPPAELCASHSSALGIRISVRQFVFSWATSALFPYARRTSIGFHSPFLTSAAAAATGVLRMSTSGAVGGSR